MDLPIEFLDKMKGILSEEYNAFLDSYQQPRNFGLRVNRLKVSPEEFERLAPFHLKRIPWVDNGFYYEEGDFPSRHPYYCAGLYYLQEPSAMTPASRLPVEPGERVLDLCAAPGGKATELGARLRGEGLLAANDISASRARALLRNIEGFGIPNAFLLNEVPARLAERFPEFFDKILVDAPCSGEGMFRKDENVAKAWSPEKPQECAKIQKSLILQAADMLRSGGMMLYSTCTFSPEENEQVIAHLLAERPDMQLETMEGYGGFAPGRPDLADGNPELEKCVRIWPHRMAGEGHFLALLRKGGGLSAADGSESGGKAGHSVHAPEEEKRIPGVNPGTRRAADNPGWISREEERRMAGANPDACCAAGNPGQMSREGKRRISGVNPGTRRSAGNPGQMSREEKKILDEFFRDVSAPYHTDQMEVRGGKVYLLSGFTGQQKGLTFLRNGLYLGELKKNRFEPGQAFAVALRGEDYASVLGLSRKDERVARYLRGETIEAEEHEVQRPKGWQLVCVDGFPLGWGKLVNGRLKNKYLASWRKENIL